MKALLITLGAAAVVAGVVYYFRDNENVKQVLDKVSDTTNDMLDKVNNAWSKGQKQASNVMAEQA